MSNKKEWQNFSLTLRELLNLEYSPVAVTCLKKPLIKSSDKKSRICRAILDAGKGATIHIDKDTNACFGAAWHLGFIRIKDPKIRNMVKKFVVQGEKLFSSYEALDKLISQLEEPPDNINFCFALAPLEKSEFRPELVIFICDAEVACRLLTFATFFEGIMPQIKIGGPTCRLAIIYPLQTGQVNISFYDYTARKLCNVDKDKLLVSMPYNMVPKIVENIDKCSAGKAKIEYPQEFREFLQKRLVKR